MANVVVSASAGDLERAVGDYVAALSAEAVSRKGSFVVALSGGSMPQVLGRALAGRSDVEWAAWRVCFADERCVPLDHADSNFRACDEHLFSVVGLPRENVLAIDPELAPAEAAAAYQGRLEALDLVLLGMGPDGHTASLFPGHPLLAERELLVASIEDSPKPPASRITLTLRALCGAANAAFITTGASKAEMLPLATAAAAASPPSAATPPAGLVQPSLPSSPPVTWFVDAAAASRL